MSRQLPNPGTYQARRTSPIVVREEESGSLMAYIACALTDSEVKFSFVHSQCIGLKDGSVSQKSVATLKKIFPGWDATNPFALEEIPLSEEGAAEFELGDCFHDEYTPKATDENPDPQPVQTFKAQWLNPIGGGLPTKQPMTEAERKKVLTKWGGKFKAVSGGTKAATTTPAKSAVPEKPDAKTSAPKPPSRKPAAAAKVSSQEEVWTELKKANADADDDALAAKFYGAQDEVAPDANGELTPEQWGEVATKLEV